MNEKLYAFWEYDAGRGIKTYNHGLIESFTETGRVRVKNYTGFTFKPAKILPYEAGIALAEKIDREQGMGHERVKQAVELSNNLIKDIFNDC